MQITAQQTAACMCAVINVSSWNQQPQLGMDWLTQEGSNSSANTRQYLQHVAVQAGASKHHCSPYVHRHLSPAGMGQLAPAVVSTRNLFTGDELFYVALCCCFAHACR
jgi:hypothetical protein